MYRTLIIARMRPGSEANVAEVFAESDRTELPRVAGVTRRELYVLGDAYVHLLETDRPTEAVMGTIRDREDFRRISTGLEPYISAYLPTWQSPRDAVARRFYHYDPAGSPRPIGGQS